MPLISTSKSRQSDRHLADDILKYNFVKKSLVFRFRHLDSPPQSPVTREWRALMLNKRLSKQSTRRWFDVNPFIHCTTLGCDGFQYFICGCHVSSRFKLNTTDLVKTYIHKISICSCTFIYCSKIYKNYVARLYSHIQNYLPTIHPPVLN